MAPSSQEWEPPAIPGRFISWNKAGLSLKNCSINLSPTQVSNTQLLDVFDSVISETGIDPTCLEIEITESALMNRIEAINGVLGKLRDRGVAVSIDDFGTGYSSLVHLQQLQLDKLKIDRTFVANIDECSENAAFAGSIVAMGQSIGLEIIAEGVETAEQLAVLRNLGCDSLQGYFFSRPLPADQFFDWCKTRVANW